MPPSRPFDLLIIGGGINGAGIARDAAGRGLKVMLVEQGDLASATSSASSKLIHGGLRYLEHFEFRLVRESLAEREVLLRIAPHITKPLTFVLPHAPDMRPAWMIRCGLFLYDHLARRDRLPGSQSIDLRSHPAGAPLQPRFTRGFTYADGWVDDSRLVVLNAVDAQARGGIIQTHTTLVRARRNASTWLADIRGADGVQRTIVARIIVNAAGPWVADVQRRIGATHPIGRVRLVKGSHIVVPRLYVGEQAYILQQPDKRVVFLLPFQSDFTLIGTTESAHDAAPGPVAISADETGYLCAAANRFLARPVAPADVVWSYAGVRALQDDASNDPSAISRDYALELDAGNGAAPLLSVIGGKITTYRCLAERVLAKLTPWLPGLAGAWTDAAPLPGGDMGAADVATYLANFQARHPWLPPALARRLVHTYGTRAERVIGDAQAFTDLGADLGCGLTGSEIAYLREVEFAQSADDILWRRSKLGLTGDRLLAERLAAYIAKL